MERYLSVDNVNLVVMSGSHQASISFYEASSLPSSVMKSYQTKFPQGDVWIDALKQRKTHAVYKSGDLYPNRRLVDTRFYDEFLKPIKMFHCAGGFFESRKEGFGMLSALLPLNAGEFDAKRLSRMQELFPLLRSAINTSSDLSMLQFSLELSGNLLDSCESALGLVDASARLVYANDRFEHLVRREHILKVKDGRVVFQCAPARTWLSQQLRHFSRHGEIDPSRFEYHFSDGAFDELRVSLSVLGGEAAGLLPTTGPVVLISIHGCYQQEAVQASLRSMGLPPVATLVAYHLMLGKSVREVSDTIQVNHETVRSHVKNLFRHFGVTNQRQLMQVLFALFR
ncbi:helix-turn-helix transcriptional regulator [Marinobacter sp. F4216]|uniref:helix-turn-helix transcriptional regulator n=1 Tax=Marinobacter sp. F4216 TaxID=2874281 RepID=UPI001CBABC50|nr:LuxR C-terminal-related transcriptional regulator [Marinobacter sp. F4216]MBZ2168256.1 LuxR C-terminal-related transcriptional regulator [Marinobacter sp. F4216]